MADPFRALTGLGISGDFGAVGRMQDRIMAGEAVDVVILTKAILDQLAQSGHVVPDSINDLGHVVTGIALRKDAPVPDLSTPDALRDLLLASDGIYLSDPVHATAGRHFTKVIETLGITDQLADRMHMFGSGHIAMAALDASKDKTPVGCTQITEILTIPSVSFAGALPDGFGLVTPYSAGVSAHAAHPEAAQTLVSLLTAGDTAAARLRAGFSE
jgi:molybdate transport system substrate-binding protein